MTPADRARDSYLSWSLAIAALREIAIRKHRILPSPDRPDEARWAREGYRGPKALDTVRGDYIGGGA